MRRYKIYSETGSLTLYEEVDEEIDEVAQRPYTNLDQYVFYVRFANRAGLKHGESRLHDCEGVERQANSSVETSQFGEFASGRMDALGISNQYDLAVLEQWHGNLDRLVCHNQAMRGADLPFDLVSQVVGSPCLQFGSQTAPRISLQKSRYFTG